MWALLYEVEELNNSYSNRPGKEVLLITSANPIGLAVITKGDSRDLPRN